MLKPEGSNAKSPAVKKPKKKSKGKKETNNDQAEEEDVEEEGDMDEETENDDDDSDDEVMLDAIKKEKALVAKKVKEIIKDADLTTLTMKEVRLHIQISNSGSF